MSKSAALMESLLKLQIKKEGLYDTGALYNSIKVKAIINNRGFSFEIEAEDYFEFLNAKYKLTENVINNKQLQTSIEEEIAAMIEKQLK